MSPPRKKGGCLDWDGMIQKGENPNGQISQTANETVRDQQALPRQEWKWNQSADGRRWNNGFDQNPDAFTVPAVPGRKRR